MWLDSGSPGPVLFRQAVQACGAWYVGVSGEGAGDVGRVGWRGGSRKAGNVCRLLEAMKRVLGR